MKLNFLVPTIMTFTVACGSDVSGGSITPSANMTVSADRCETAPQITLKETSTLIVETARYPLELLALVPNRINGIISGCQLAKVDILTSGNTKALDYVLFQNDWNVSSVVNPLIEGNNQFEFTQPEQILGSVRLISANPYKATPCWQYNPNDHQNGVGHTKRERDS